MNRPRQILLLNYGLLICVWGLGIFGFQTGPSFGDEQSRIHVSDITQFLIIERPKLSKKVTGRPMGNLQITPQRIYNSLRHYLKKYKKWPAVLQQEPLQRTLPREVLSKYRKIAC